MFNLTRSLDKRRFILSLQPAEIRRYSRQLPILGLDGQLKLKQAKILCVGAGGLGSPALQYLSACGLGTLGIIDGDVVELSNLQRQILFTEQDVGHKKADVAAARLKAMNQHCQINVDTNFLTEKNATILDPYDVVLDASDNYKTRYLLNDRCRALKKPLVSASIYQYEAQLSVFNYLDGPCYQCLYPEPPPESLSPNCTMRGVLGVLPGVAGTLQATEAIKIILGVTDTLSGILLSFDLLSLRFNQFQIPKQRCDHHPKIQFKHEEKSNVKESPSMSPIELYHLLQSNPQDIQLIDVREPYEREICHIGGELIPLAALSNAIPRFNRQQAIIIYCRSGVRSAQALQMFLNAGFTDVHHLDGGILAWQAQIDPQLTRY